MFDPEKPPELMVSRWLNAKAPLSLAALKDRVVVLTAFQMLCPGCIEHGLPQARRIADRFDPAQVAVIGLHTVFEHHDVMTPAALDVFMHEYKWPFPVGIDEPDGKGIPRTMAAYEMRGTPTMLVFDRAGRLRRHYFGRPDDMMIAAELAALATEEPGSPRDQAAAIERKLAKILRAPAHDHHHHGDGHGHHHDHEHHGHVHGPGCTHDGCAHDHAHVHGHTHGAGREKS